MPRYRRCQQNRGWQHRDFRAPAWLESWPLPHIICEKCLPGDKPDLSSGHRQIGPFHRLGLWRLPTGAVDRNVGGSTATSEHRPRLESWAWPQSVRMKCLLGDGPVLSTGHRRFGPFHRFGLRCLATGAANRTVGGSTATSEHRPRLQSWARPQITNKKCLSKDQPHLNPAFGELACSIGLGCGGSLPALSIEPWVAAPRLPSTGLGLNRGHGHDILQSSACRETDLI